LVHVFKGMANTSGLTGGRRAHGGRLAGQEVAVGRHTKAQQTAEQQDRGEFEP
jgi:hypothetical protein